jgi:hypothetical protein
VAKKGELAMPLIISDTILDEEVRDPSTGATDEHDVLSNAPIAAALAAVTDSSDFFDSPTGFPQFAEKTNFVSSGNTVTDYFLGNSGGDPLLGVASDLYVGSDRIFMYSTTDSNIVVGRVGNGTTADPAGSIALVLLVQETKNSDGVVTAADLWIGLYAPVVNDGENLVDNADELDLTGLIYLGSDFSTQTEVPFENFASVPSGQDAFALVGPTSGSSDVDLLITGFKGNTVSTVNVSTQGLGSGAQAVDEGESLRIDIVDANAADFGSADEPSEVHDAANISYTGGHQDAVAARFEIEQTNPNKNTATVTVNAYHTATNVQGSGFSTNAISSPGTPVEIDVEDVVILNAAGTDVTAAFLLRGGTISAAGTDGVRITGLLAHEQVSFSTDGEAFNRFTVTNTDNTSGPDTWDLGAIVVTVLEGGSDTELEELGSHLIFQDDGPLIAASGDIAPTLTVDETLLGTDDTDDFSGLFGAPDYGADGAGTVEYSLGVSSAGANSGLTDTATGNSVFLFLEAGQVIGREGTGALDAEAGDIVFVISSDSDANVTLDQRRAVVHAVNPNPNDITGFTASTLVTLTATAFDSEATGSNDSDSATVNIGDAFDFYDDGATITAPAPENLVVENTANDSASAVYDLEPGNDGHGSFKILGPADATGDFQWTFDGTDQDAITGTYKGMDLYTLALDPDGTYTFNMIGTLPSSSLDLNTAEIKAGAPDTNSIDVGVLQNDQFVTITGGNGNINESNAFVGVANGNLDVGESLTFELFDGNTQLTFDGISIGTKSAQASQYSWTATLADGGTDSGTESVGKNGTILIDSLDLDGETITSITITKLTGQATKIGLGDIELLMPPDDVTLDFDVRLTDGDGDWTDESFSVSIDGNNDGDITNAVSVLSVFESDLLLL